MLSLTGFKTCDKLKEGELIYTWNNGRLELQPVRKVIIKLHSGVLHAYKGRHYNQTVTPYHRMLVKKHDKDEYEIKRSEEVFDIKTPRMLPVRFKESEVTDCKLSDAEIILAAMIYTDGSIEKRKGEVHRVRLYKSPKRYGNELIETVCEELSLSYTLKKCHSLGVVNKYEFYGENARRIVDLVESKYRIANKFINLPMSQAQLFLDVWSKFDGNNDEKLLQYNNENIADALQQIAIDAGYCSYRKHKRKTNYIKLMQVDNIIPTERVEVEYDGLV